MTSTPTTVARVALGCLIAALALVTPAGAQQRFLRDGIDLTNLRFIGLEQEGYEVSSLLTVNDAALLVATDQPRTLNYLISGRLPVRSSRIQQLIEWGLLRQTGDGFESQIPVIRGDTAARLNEILDEVAPTIAAESLPAMQRLSDRLWRHPGVSTLPAVTAWMLRDRVWDHLISANGLDFERRLLEQQATFPERGFWGALWYTEAPVPPAYDLYEWRRDEYTIQLAWNYGEGDPFFGQEDSSVSMQDLLAKLDDDGRRLDDHEDFPGALAAGMVEENGDMRIFSRRYRLEDSDGLAFLIEEVAVAITEAYLRHLPATTLAPMFKTTREVASVIAYTELAPRLVSEFHEAGLLVRAADPRAEWRVTLETQSREDGRPRTATVMAENPTASVTMPDYAAMIWRDLPARPRLRIVWW